ncbi:HNH endonuclease [Candidatus Njordibacter sp. Uisw_056]|jgi:hypothetical protein|uniref:HNH endonuclease n=1 Tax=Candidatus Njordibacter sp. Uisw_056 TaxID=3230973 RepID=UPI003D54A590
MKYWWVNQNKTYKSEVPGGFLWSPKTKSNGHRNKFYDFMMEVQEGDLVFSFCSTRIKAVGIAVGSAQSAPKPNFGSVGDQWANEGWLVPVEFQELGNPVRPKDHMFVLAPHLPSKYSPLTKSGDGLQSVYLASLPVELAHGLINLFDLKDQLSITQITSLFEPSYDESAEDSIVFERKDIGPTTKEQLVKSRRGQGVFKSNLRLVEKSCRITGTNNIKHLIASHIKPWKDSNDIEKLDGNNGLLLAPHIDHLFDKGYITFKDSGEVLYSELIDSNLIPQWDLMQPTKPKPLNSSQATYMSFHRSHIFKKP